MKISFIILAAAVPLFMMSCGNEPPTKVYNWRIQDAPTTVKKAPSRPSSSYKVGGGGTRYVGGSDTASGFRAAE